MKTHIGEEGTEQFTINTLVDGKVIRSQPIHDPFIHNTTVIDISRWEHFLSVFMPKTVKVEVSIRGSEGVQRAIMTLDPEQLAQDTRDILREREISRESSGTIGFCSV